MPRPMVQKGRRMYGEAKAKARTTKLRKSGKKRGEAMALRAVKSM